MVAAAVEWKHKEPLRRGWVRRSTENGQCQMSNTRLRVQNSHTPDKTSLQLFDVYNRGWVLNLQRF